MKVKEEWKSWLKTQHSENRNHGIRSHHFMANRWRNSGNSDTLYFSGSKITADGDCSHGIKRCLLLGRKVMTNLDSIFKSRDITLSTKIHLFKAMVFPVVMYVCESWTIRKADLREQHWNMYIIICETDCQSRCDVWDRVLRAGALGWPWGPGWGGRGEGGSGWGTYVHLWMIHVNVWQKPLLLLLLSRFSCVWLCVTP